MAFPVGVSVAIIEAGRAFTSVGSDVSMSAKVTPIFRATDRGTMKRIVHAATGHPMLASTEEFKAEAGSVLSFAVPHVDQPGWQAPSGEAYTMWYYAVEITARVGNGRNSTGHVWKQNVQPLVGQDFIDLDLVADGPTGEPVTAPQAYVTDVEGQTGSVVIGPIVGAAIDQAVLDGRIPLPEIDVTETAPGVYDLGSGQTVYGLTAAQELPGPAVASLDTRYAPVGALTEVPDADVAALVSDGLSETNTALSATYATKAEAAAKDADVATHITATSSATRNALTDATFTFMRDREAYYIKRSDIAAGANNRDVILNAVNAAAASGVKKVVLPPGEITIGAQVTIPANAHGLQIVGHGEDTVIKQNTNGVNQALFYGTGADGTKYTTASDFAAGSTSVTVPEPLALTLTAGSLMGLECNTIVYGNGISGQEGRASEIRSVVAISGNTVVLDGPLLHNYTVAAGAVAWRMTPLRGVGISDLVLTSSDPTVIRARGISFAKGQDITVSGIHLLNAGGGIYYNDVLDSLTSDIHVDGLPNHGNFLGYGVAVGGRSAHATVENLHGRNFRHIFTTLADERNVSGTITQWGGPRHVTVRGGVGEARKDGTGYAIWDTHPYGTDVVFDNCRAFGGSGASSHGFQIRSKKTKILNGTAFRPGKSGVRVDPVAADDVEINGGEFAFCSEGIAVGRNTRVHGAWIHDNTGVGLQLGAGAAATRSHIFGNVIENNPYGLQDISDGTHTGVVVQGNTIPKSAVQNFAFLSPKGNLVYANNVALGYGAGSDGVGGTPGPDVKRSGNITD